ncbi:MAG: bifunctional folylpolyglutamate synthase/dihydrofolate synthase, partial [Nitrospinota bacterium]
MEGFLDALANLPRPSYRPRRDARGVRFQGPGLGRTERLLELVGSPERGMRIVHVAGTSGKGSVTLMLAEALRAAGRRVGAFFSPHLTSFVERFWAEGRLVVPGPDAFRAFCEACRQMALEPVGTPSYFEGTLALALLTFRERGCQDALLEAGLGGSYDATAAVRPAALDVITTVGLDHTDILGDTAREVARDKTGIITRGGEVLFGWGPKEAQAEVRKAVQERGARLRPRPEMELQGVEFGGTRLAITFEDGKRWGELFTPMVGEHQAKNAALAAAAARLLGVGEDQFRQGLARARLPGRVEVLAGSPNAGTPSGGPL